MPSYAESDAPKTTLQDNNQHTYTLIAIFGGFAIIIVAMIMFYQHVLDNQKKLNAANEVLADRIDRIYHDTTGSDEDHPNDKNDEI